MITLDEVNKIANGLIRKYDWQTETVARGVKLIVTDGDKRASVVITEGEDIESEAKRLIEAVDKHQYEELEG